MDYNEFQEEKKKLRLDIVDIELIYQMRFKSLYPATEEEFFEVLKILNENKKVKETIFSYNKRMYVSLTDFYREKLKSDEDCVKNILTYLSLN